MNRFHKVFSLVLAFAIGAALALYSFERISDPEPARQRAREEAVVLAAREFLISHVPAAAEIEIVDPLATNRVAGKVYVYPTSDGWEVSGYYRRAEGERWHPFLMVLDSNVGLVSLSVRDKDAATIEAAAANPQFSVAQ